MFKAINDLVISNPKRNTVNTGKTSWFPYYAGYSPSFVYNLIKSCKLDTSACIGDPWNGGGTTTTIANALGYDSKGLDLNPVMAIAAKACLINTLDSPSIHPIANDLVKKSLHISISIEESDPLTSWLDSESVKNFRKLEKALRVLLVEKHHHVGVHNQEININALSCLTCFFYVSLFRVIRILVKPFQSSNPTWVKKAKESDVKISIPQKELLEIFTNEITLMVQKMNYEALYNETTTAKTEFKVGSSLNIPWKDRSADLIITSPPYCTRIDYAIATLPELAVLGFRIDSTFDKLRNELIGTTLTGKGNFLQNPLWGESCLKFLSDSYNHSSKASKSYYYKYHVQYYNALFNSFIEINRVLKKDAICVMVVQDSYYKDIHNDLPKIFLEMASNNGLENIRRDDFPLSRTLAGINPQVKKYRNKATAIESVLCFKK